MAEDAGDIISEGRLDLVPMIDCIMLLLIFLILSTRFMTEERAIGSLLPTDRGPGPPPSQIVERQDIAIVLVPDLPITRRHQDGSIRPGAYRDAFRDAIAAVRVADARDGVRLPGGALLRIGNHAPLPFAFRQADGGADPGTAATVAAIHAHVHAALARHEQPGVPRARQQPVIIHAFSGLAWQEAITVYDAVRAYERARTPPGGAGDVRDPLALRAARTVTFAAPRLRGSSVHEPGDELDELMRRR